MTVSGQPAAHARRASLWSWWDGSWGLASVIVAVSVALHVPILRQPFLYYEFRQTQTALQAREFAEHGINLFDPQLPLFGPPWKVPFELPVFQALASIPIKLGLGADAAMHATGLVFFALSALLLFGLVRRIGSIVAAFAALIAFSLSPFALVWGASSLIEYFVTACMLAFLWAGILWRDTGRRGYAVTAVALGSLGVLTKANTAIFWTIPYFTYGGVHVSSAREWIKARLAPRVWVVAVIPAVLGAIWTLHADSVKSDSPATRWLTSSRLQEFTFGTWAQRTKYENWAVVFDRIADLIVGRYVFVGLIVLGLVCTRRRGVWIGLALTVGLTIATFLNLYVIHDYYLIALSPALAALLGLGVDVVWRAARGRVSPAVVGIALVLVWIVPMYWATGPYWRPALDGFSNTAAPTAAAIADAVPRGEPVVVQGLDWNPTYLYYAHRRGLMLRPNLATPAVARLMHDADFRHWFANAPLAAENDLLRTWPWVAATGARTYRMSDTSARALGDAPVIATSDRDAIARMRASGTRLTEQPVRVECDGKSRADVPIQQGSTLLDMPKADRRNVRIFFRSGLAPIPGFRAAVYRGGRTSRSLRLMCGGGGTIRVTPYALDADAVRSA